MSFVQTEGAKSVMMMTYEEKRQAARSLRIKKDKQEVYLHRVYTMPDESFPPIRCYLPMRFSKKVTNDEEKYRIQCLVCDAYMKRPAFRDYIDTNCDFVAEEGSHIWVSNGFHESMIEDKTVTHFTIRLHKCIGGNTNIEIGSAMHMVVDRFELQIFKITLMVEL